MSLSGAMNTAVSALSAQSQALSVISNNLANSSTTGYKAVTTSFSSLMTQSYTGTTYSGAGVTSAARQNVSAQGTIEASSSATDMAIDGNGMFVVGYGDDNSSLYFTRNGEFDQDAEGYLVSSNCYLLGWPTDDNGNLTVTEASATLQKINVTNNVSSVAGTENVTIDADLGPNTATAVSTAASSQLTSTDAADLSGLTVAAGDQISATTADGTTITYTLADADFDGVLTLAEVASSINGTTGANVTATVVTDSSGNATLSLSDSNTITAITGTAATSLGLIDTSGAVANPTQSGEYTTSMEVYDSLGNLHTVSMQWDKTATNEWSLTFSSADGTSTTAATTLQFDGDGQLTSPSPASLTLDFAWNNGSNTSSIAVDLSSLTQTYGSTGVSQASVDTDGHASGKLLGVSISDDGTVTASYDNGQAIPIYKVAIATFANYDGLQALSHGIYQASSDSGDYTLHLAGEGGSGTVSASSLESSTVDTADEFTRMIVAQQAYSAASQVITTAKDMYDALISAVR